ncbi:MAG: winged helix-turn-helix domain-containing protein [Patescibacteria group bacterium]|jgi:Fe2+ or Zn2+ uptake regulation protein|nr:winged helix-turn-helix domain-containing protein [Patescibacteria group bacterium]
MFEQLFGSKTRVKLLSLFYNNPDRPFYVREITRKIDEQINSVRRELQNLLNIGIVRSVSQSNRLYYEINAKYKFHKELESIFQRIPAKTKDIKQTKEEDQVLKALQKSGNVRMAFLTGAFVRGSNQQIDIFIVGDMNKSQLARVVGDMEKEMNRELNYAAMTVEDFDYRRNLNDRFLNDILDENKIVLADRISVFTKDPEVQETDSDETTKLEVKPKV